jgi:hypothetical protein
MKETRYFIPRDKPKLWVIGILAGLCGFGSGLLAFGATWFGLPLAKVLFTAMFFVCWATFVVSWIGFVFGLVCGRYRRLTERPWPEQVW